MIAPALTPSMTLSATDRMVPCPNPVVRVPAVATVDSLNPPSSRALAMTGEKSSPSTWVVPGNATVPLVKTLVPVGGRHDAVRGEQDCRRDSFELLLLVLPGGSEVALQVGVLLELGVGVGREHLAVGVDVDALSGGLLEEGLQVFQVVSGDDDGGPGLDAAGDGRGRRGTEGLGVGAVQHLHAGQVGGSDGHDLGEELVHTAVGADGAEALVDLSIDGSICVSEDHRVVGVCAHTAETEEDQGLQGADVLVGSPELGHVHGLDVSGRFLDGRDLGPQVRAVEVDVAQGGEHGPDDHAVGLGGGLLAVQGLRQGHEGACQLILQQGSFCGLSADSGRSGAAFAARGLLALETEHLVGHFVTSQSVIPYRSCVKYNELVVFTT